MLFRAEVCKYLKRGGNLKVRRVGGTLAAGALLGALLLVRTPAQEFDTTARAAVVPQPGDSTPTISAAGPQPQSPERPAPSTVTYSAGIADILKMTDAGVGTEVVEAYVRNSATPYQPSAAEIIALKEHGVPSDVIVALLARGGELRSLAAQAQPDQAGSASSPAPLPQSAETAAPATAPAYAYGPQPAYSVSSHTYPAVVYPGYSYWWYDYSYASPYFYRPLFSVGYYGYSHPYYHGRSRPYYSHSGPWGPVYGRPRHSGVRAGFSYPHRGSGVRPPTFGGRSVSFTSHSAVSRSAGFSGRPSGFGGRSSGRSR